MREFDVCLAACSSASEGLIFRGYFGDSGDCTSSEDEKMEWSDAEASPQQQLGGALEDQLEECPAADQNVAARRSPCVTRDDFLRRYGAICSVSGRFRDNFSLKRPFSSIFLF